MTCILVLVTSPFGQGVSEFVRVRQDQGRCGIVRPMITFGKKYRYAGGAACFGEPDGILNPGLQNPLLAGFGRWHIAVQNVEEQQRSFHEIKMVDVHGSPS
jgi:hypothetical protein